MLYPIVVFFFFLQVLLRAKETIFIPFRYQGYETDQFVPPQSPGHVFKHSATSLQPKDSSSSHGSILSKVVTVGINQGMCRICKMSLKTFIEIRICTLGNGWAKNLISNL